MTTEIDRTIELSVDGMTCGHCVMSVSEELREIPGVKDVEVILNSGGTSKVTVVTDTPLDDAALGDAVSENPLAVNDRAHRALIKLVAFDDEGGINRQGAWSWWAW